MKTIIAVTDHSTQAAHAARYALHLAKKIKANVLLCDIASLHHRALVLNDNGPYAVAEDQLPVQNTGLLNLQNALEEELNGQTLPGQFMPAIACQSQETPFGEAPDDYAAALDIAFVVLAGNIYYGASSIMPGKACGEILKTLKSPMILVPEHAPIRYAEKYVFMADITCNNVPTLTDIAKLAGYSAAELMLVNINNGRPLDKDQEDAIKSIMTETIWQIDYGRIYYRHLPNSVLKSDVEWLIQDNRFEMLAMIYNSNSMLNQLLRFDYTDKLIGNINVPLLIYPSIN